MSKADDALIISRKRLANRMGCSEKTVSRMFGRGDLPGCIKLGGRTAPLRMTEKSMDKLLNKRRR